MDFRPSNFHDIDRYFRGTWVKLKEFGERLFYIARVTATEITGKDENDDEFILYLEENRPYHLDYTLPTKAVFQHGDYAYLLFRVPARQYKRGCSEENTRFHRIHDGAGQGFDLKFLRSFTNKEDATTLHDAVFGKSKLKCVAFGKRFAFYRRTNQLFCDNTVIGSLDRQKGELMVLKPFHPEIKTLLDKNNPRELRIV